LKVLLSKRNYVYGVAVEGSAIPGYGSCRNCMFPLRARVWATVTSCPGYTYATGGELFSGFSRDAIEATYASALGEARTSTTLGYVTHATPSNHSPRNRSQGCPPRSDGYRQRGILSDRAVALTRRIDDSRLQIADFKSACGFQSEIQNLQSEVDLLAFSSMDSWPRTGLQN